MATAWVIRSGKYGERDQWALENGVSGGGWREFGDLTPYATKEEVAAAVGAAFPGASASRLANYTGQVYALRARIKPGDLLVMPLKTTNKIAIGRVTDGYTFLADETDPDRRHVVKVDWQRTELPRTAVKQDLLFTLGSAMSIFAPSKNNAVVRLEHLLTAGTDPGSTGASGGAAGSGTGAPSPSTSGAVSDV